MGASEGKVSRAQSDTIWSGRGRPDQMVSDWARETFPSLAPTVRVPVQFSIAEYEKVWQTDDSGVAEITELFAGSPRFSVHRQPGAGHNISLGYTAPDYHAKVFAFAADCVDAPEPAASANEEEAG